MTGKPVLVLTLRSATETCAVRTPVLACADVLRSAGAACEDAIADSDGDIDAALDRLADGTRLVVAATSDGELRAVIRRMVRRWAPPPSARTDDLPADRTVPDLPPVGLLPLHPASVKLVRRLGLPGDPAAVAAAVLGGRTRRLDLLRVDSGSVTLHGALLGGVDDRGRAVQWLARVEVDDTVLSDGTEPLLACAVANAAGYAAVDGLPLAPDADPADGMVDVAVALARRERAWTRRGKLRFEVRRATGRAVVCTPRASVPVLDDGVHGTLTRKRTWWMERAAWALYVA